MQTGATFATAQGEKVLLSAEKFVDGDKFEAFCRNPSESDPFYEATRLSLLEIKETTGCTYLYTMTASTPRDAVYIIDGSAQPDDPEMFSPLGTHEDITSYGSAPFDAMKYGKMTTAGIEKQEEWGYIVSTYCPIKNSRGQSVGFIGCDYNVDELMITMRRKIVIIAAIGTAFLVLGIVIVNFFMNVLFRRVRKISEAMNYISNGTADLSARIPIEGNNELSVLAISCNAVIESLDNLMGSLQAETQNLTRTEEQLSGSMDDHAKQITQADASVADIVSSVADQAERIATINQEVQTVKIEIAGLDSRIVQQSDAIQQSSTAVEQISASIKAVDKNIDIITHEYQNLVKESSAGRQMQDHVSEQIENIARQSENLTEANAAISSIAEQTNLLAMNAAIEAAHAGELGKGFGVVADEIRALAETSASQSSSIKELLEGISEAISGIVDSSKRSADSFDSVGTKINQLDSLIHQVQEGMSEQESGVNGILQTMKTLNSTTCDITTASSHIKEASSKVFSNVRQLQTLSRNTSDRSMAVQENMTAMRQAAQVVVDASGRSLAAVHNMAERINGFRI